MRVSRTLAITFLGLGLGATAQGQEVSSRDLVAGQHYVAGTVSTWQAGGSLFVKYETANGWSMSETHLAAATSLAGIPQSGGGFIPGQFLFARTYRPYSLADTFEVDISGVLAPLGEGACQDIYVAAHAVVLKEGGGGGGHDGGSGGGGCGKDSDHDGHDHKGDPGGRGDSYGWGGHSGSGKSGDGDGKSGYGKGSDTSGHSDGYSESSGKDDRGKSTYGDGKSGYGRTSDRSGGRDGSYKSGGRDGHGKSGSRDDEEDDDSSPPAGTPGTETAWANGLPAPGNNWAMYFTTPVCRPGAPPAPGPVCDVTDVAVVRWDEFGRAIAVQPCFCRSQDPYGPWIAVEKDARLPEVCVSQ